MNYFQCICLDCLPSLFISLGFFQSSKKKKIRYFRLYQVFFSVYNSSYATRMATLLHRREQQNEELREEQYYYLCKKEQANWPFFASLFYRGDFLVIECERMTSFSREIRTKIKGLDWKLEEAYFPSPYFSRLCSYFQPKSSETWFSEPRHMSLTWRHSTWVNISRKSFGA